MLQQCSPVLGNQEPQLFLCSCDKALSIRSVRKIMYSLDDAHQRNIIALTYLPEHCLSVSAGQDRKIKVWNTDKENQKLKEELSWKAHQLPIMTIAASPDEKYIASGSRDYSLKVWALERSQQELLTSSSIDRNVITSIKWVNSNQILECSEDLSVRVWDLRSGEGFDGQDFSLNWTKIVHSGATFALSCDINRRNENEVITGHTGFNGSGCVVQAWDLRKFTSKGVANEPVWKSLNNQEKVTKVQYYYEEQGVKVMSVSMDSSLSMLNAENGNLVQKWQNPVQMMTGFQSMAVLDSKESARRSGLIISATIEPKFKLFSVREGSLVQEL